MKVFFNPGFLSFIAMVGCCLLLNGSPVYGQEKIELEERVNKKEVPVPAKEWLGDAFEKRKRHLKWYRETGEGDLYFEAKFKYQDTHYSVKFTESGEFFDLEFLIDFSSLPKQTRTAILEYLQNKFSSFKIEKIQEQWTGDAGDVEDAIDEGEWEGIRLRYELEYFDRRGGDLNLYEGLFDNEGQLVRERKVRITSTLNMDY